MEGKEEEIKFGSRRQNISLKNLYLDTNNYRFIDSEHYRKTTSAVNDYTNRTNQSNTERLIRGERNLNIKDLIDSFRTNGFVEIDQIQVRELGTGKYLVLEGNRRVATLKYLEAEYKLGNPIGQLDPTIFTAVPVIIYTDNNEQHHRILMGLKHINGNKRWPAINQAQLLQDLETSGMPEAEIRSALGITKLTYSRYIYTLKLITDYKESIYGDQFRTTMFNIFAEIVRKQELMSWLQWDERSRFFNHTNNKNRLFSWLSKEPKTDDTEEREDGDITDYDAGNYEPIITKGTDIRDLAKFITDEDALTKMEEARTVAAGKESSKIVGEDVFNSSLDTIDQQLGIAYGASRYAKLDSKIRLQDLKKKINGLIATQEGSIKTETQKDIIRLNGANVSQHFTEITIGKYKAFNKVEVKNLRQINLFAGVNNAGKSTLLEAIYFLVKQNDVFSFFDMYRRRGKFFNKFPSTWLHLNLQDDIEVSGVFNHQTTSLKIHKENDYATNGTEDINDSAYLSTLNFTAKCADDEAHSSYDLYEDNTDKAQINAIQEVCNISFSSPFSTADGQQLLKLYNANLQHLAPIVDFIQHNIDSKLSAILINSDTLRFNVIHDDFDVPQDLTQFGDGLQRVFHIALQFAAARNGIALIDEIENAIHHSLFKKLIPFIKQLAEKFNVQVFITSHSKECIDAFFDDDVYNEKIAIYNLSRNKEGNILCKYDSGELFGELIELINADARGGNE
ncbi:MAG: AAA family ATPase [Saprospiraceae bacterium]|nr:AAA family ATPase [Saprospiraceae bacterium]